ncbi:LANO_0H21000g1_1 [Lachancea nothofagi CBS 11611]|uniref:LANO_0H21000g1_1 n=1 Tax=Lachancea nothofagi CBS 11611 TaxID=1266666 RepID=A0A1G4KNN8_9SACH|nr:LANO_0H21000g1_1 [Lachancea nothofagi CBS 11611]
MVLPKDEIAACAKRITSSNDRRSYNDIVKLVSQYPDLSQLDESKFEIEEPALRYLTMALLQIFRKLFSRGQLNPAKATSEKEKLFSQWCRKVYGSYKAKLLHCISSIPFETSLALDCLDVYMQLLEQEAIFLASRDGAPFFPNKTLKALILAIFKSNIQGSVDATDGHSKNPIVLEFTSSYYKKYVDIQYYFQAELTQLITDSAVLEDIDHTQLMAKWISIMNHDNHYSSKDADLEIYVSEPPQAMENEAQYKSNLEKNWLAFLNLSGLPATQYKTTLLILHKRIIPHFQTPTKLMDFLTDSYNLGDDVVSLLALNGLFELMRRYNLEYPNFYAKLYQLVTPTLMHIKHRSRFLRLTDLFLSSTHISANMVASFIKRLARLTLDSPPSAIVSVIPFVYNLMKKHPTCMIMLHDPDFVVDPFATLDEIALLKERKAQYVDPFQMGEVNPELTGAIDSSLWELESLTNHYHPNVATLAKIFSQPFKKHTYNMEDFLDWSYDSLLQAEITRKLKVLPALEFEEQGAAFGDYLKCVEW